MHYSGLDDNGRSRAWKTCSSARRRELGISLLGIELLHLATSRNMDHQKNMYREQQCRNALVFGIADESC